MSSINLACPEDANSTDCLLRVLLDFLDQQAKDNAKKVDWDPITFGFTAPVGILAAVFGLIAIIVAIIVASPGRRKSSARAIGQWSTSTKRKWDWKGLTWETTAVTPLLTISNVKIELGKLGKGGSNTNSNGNGNGNGSNNGSNNGNGNSNGKSNGNSWRKCLFKDYTTSGPASAPWLRFLDEIGLDYTKLRDIQRMDTLADYLPADILGAPAYGEVGFIITAMTCAGASFETASIQSSYPIIIGDGFQFDFRQHPTLGTVGAFSHHRNPQSQRPKLQPPSPEQMQLAMQHAEGKVTLSKLYQPGQPGAANTELEISAISLSSPEHVLEVVHGKGGNHNETCSNEVLFSRRDDHHLLWLLFGDLPGFPPAIFPAKAAREKNLLSALALSSEFWAKSWLGEPFKYLGGIIPGIAWSNSNDLPPDVSQADFDYVSSMLKSGGIPSGGGSSGPKVKLGFDSKWEASNKVHGLQHVLLASLRLLGSYNDFQAWYNALYSMRKRVFRVLVLLQLEQLEVWLQRADSQRVRCRVTALFLSTTTLLDLQWAIDEGALSLPDRSLSMWGSDTVEVGTDQEDVKRNAFPPRSAVSQLFPLLQMLDSLIKELPFDRQATGRPAREWTLFAASILDGILKRVANADYANPIPPSTILQPVSPIVKKYVSDVAVEVQDGVQKTAEGSDYTDECIDRVLVWRCLLMAMLFCTASDNTGVLRSGLWEHIIPIL
ncbi:hypothetical protein F5Y01DRAFT_239194 [Xylaria sp. FL0043]|nr:hypothetical protein F5Y01DRAFT_239194 [Xylaria sp. FL0043]